jgi:hypothetical protein
MGRFSPTISNFLSQVGADEFLDISEVPKSDSCASPGEILVFLYRPKYSAGTIASWRAVLVVEPVTKSAKTGNLLLTGFEVPVRSPRTYTPDSLITLYKNRELQDDDYKTFILGKPYVVGPLYKISKK